MCWRNHGELNVARRKVKANRLDQHNSFEIQRYIDSYDYFSDIEL